MQAYITSIGTSPGTYKTSQETICEFMGRSLGMNDEEKRKLRVLYRATGIKTRYSVLPDYGRAPENYDFYPRNEELNPFPKTSMRIKEYQREGILLAEKAIRNCQINKADFKLNSLTHLITVSCTGMYAPGLDIELVHKLGLPKTIKRTCINFMGCYAAFNALKVARSICVSTENASVLVVCLELCSLHFQKSRKPDDLLSSALFGDGAAVALVENTPGPEINLELVDEHCDLLEDNGENMAWNIGDFGFEMKLSSEVPDLIKKGIDNLLDNLFKKTGKLLKDIQHFAVHPGGRKILEVVENELQICREKNRASHEVLTEYGNMSSTTILFILEKILKRMTLKNKGENLLSLAFGPGLTLESILLRIS